MQKGQDALARQPCLQGAGRRLEKYGLKFMGRSCFWHVVWHGLSTVPPWEPGTCMLEPEEETNPCDAVTMQRYGKALLQTTLLGGFPFFLGPFLRCFKLWEMESLGIGTEQNRKKNKEIFDHSWLKLLLPGCSIRFITVSLFTWLQVAFSLTTNMCSILSATKR